MTATVTTFGALATGTPFTFHTAVLVGFPADTVFTKSGPFSFTTGAKAKLTLDNPKTMKVSPLAASASFWN